ncbi:MAG: hypothetical protein N2745_09340 [Syntrophorhabdaceae bacterium]|nr:hypothetical protein [Syntrophorhabdaceae bacterium]
MAILDDIKRLGLELAPQIKEEVDRIVESINTEIKDEYVRGALIEGAVGEFLMAFCPDVMDAIIKDKERENQEWLRKCQRKYDEKGNRVCEEEFCPNSEDVAPCVYCGRYICRAHSFHDEKRCCYECWEFHFGEKN